MSMFQCQILVMPLANHRGSYWCHILVDVSFACLNIHVPRMPSSFLVTHSPLVTSSTHFTLIYVDLQYTLSARTVILEKQVISPQIMLNKP